MERGVYFAGQDFHSEEPAFYLPLDIARQWTREKKAYAVNHGRDICLLPEAQAELTAAQKDQVFLLDREQSCIMGEQVMNGNVERELWACRMVRSWNPAVALAEHLRSRKRFQARKAASPERSVTKN
jgi:hypothetical protein